MPGCWQVCSLVNLFYLGVEMLSTVLEISVSRVEGAHICRVRKNILVFISSLEEDSEAEVVMVVVFVPPGPRPQVLV